MSWIHTKKSKPSRKAWVVSAGAVLIAVLGVAVGAAFLVHGARAPLRAGASGFEQTLPAFAGLGALALEFVLLAGLTWYLLREIRSLQVEQDELSILAMVANKTDHAVFLANAEGFIQWVNEGFTRVTGHLLVDAMSKQPAGVLLGALQNIN